MNINEALEVFEAGHMTRTEAAHFLVWLMQHDPQRAAAYNDAVNGLVLSGHLRRNDGGAWVAEQPTKPRNRGGRPRGGKPRQRLTVSLDPAMVAELDAHKLARYMSRNDLIVFLLRFGLDRG
jgi:hypothetical protein